jgi:uncharacterized protein YceK
MTRRYAVVLIALLLAGCAGVRAREAPSTDRQSRRQAETSRIAQVEAAKRNVPWERWPWG